MFYCTSILISEENVTKTHFKEAKCVIHSLFCRSLIRTSSILGTIRDRQYLFRDDSPKNYFSLGKCFYKDIQKYPV